MVFEIPLFFLIRLMRLLDELIKVTVRFDLMGQLLYCQLERGC